MQPEEVADLFQAIGAPPITDFSTKHKVTAKAVSVTFKVPGTDRKSVLENLRRGINAESMRPGSMRPGMVQSIELDWSTVEGLPEEGQEWPPGETDDETRDAWIRIKTGVRDWIVGQQMAHERWCVGGVNQVLAELGLEELPERQEYRVSREITATWYTLVDAYSEESAVAVAESHNKWRVDDDGDAMDGYVSPKELGPVTAVLHNDDDDEADDEDND